MLVLLLLSQRMWLSLRAHDERAAEYHGRQYDDVASNWLRD